MNIFLLAAFFSVAGIAIALSQPGQEDLILLAVPGLIASLFLFLIQRRARRIQPKLSLNPVILDGSNVMHWKDKTPQIETVREVVHTLKGMGYSPGVVFDANAGYLLAGRYKHDDVFGRELGLSNDKVMVVPKGQPADPTILRAARDLDAVIVTNDKFRDWAEDYPEISRPGHLNRGGYQGGTLWLELKSPEPASPID